MAPGPARRRQIDEERGGFSGVSLDRMIPSYGFGLRIHDIRGDYWNAEPILRLQVARSPGEDTRLMVSLGSGD